MNGPDVAEGSEAEAVILSKKEADSRPWMEMLEMSY